MSHRDDHRKRRACRRLAFARLRGLRYRPMPSPANLSHTAARTRAALQRLLLRMDGWLADCREDAEAKRLMRHYLQSCPEALADLRIAREGLQSLSAQAESYNARRERHSRTPKEDLSRRLRTSCEDLCQLPDELEEAARRIRPLLERDAAPVAPEDLPTRVHHRYDFTESMRAARRQVAQALEILAD